MIGIVNYGMGNLSSVKRKLDRLKADSVISCDTRILRVCDKLILPGVGQFSNAIKNLKEMSLWDYLNEDVIKNGKPILGICLGMQLMANHSDEGDEYGFGWIDAEIVKFNIDDKLKYKIPHIGWNHIFLKKRSLLFHDINLDSGFYFVHSYHFRTNDSSNIVGETIYEYPFVSAIQRDNIFGVQFHPEKSHDSGEQLLMNFISI
jgi:imidazole glycerol-phosphate synthase subunit HisH